MSKKCVNLLGEQFKLMLKEPCNLEETIYFLSAFLKIPENKLKKSKVYYNTLLNNVDFSRKSSNLIIMIDNIVIKLNTYFSIKQDFIIHILIGLDNSTYRKLIELSFKKTANKTGKIIEDYTYNIDNTNIELSNVMNTRLIDLNKLKDLDYQTSVNRWLKFIGAKTKEERLCATTNDTRLKKLYNWLEN